MNGCIYRTKDGECDLYAEGGRYTAFCEMENCVGRKMSNADCIRSMTDYELADWVAKVLFYHGLVERHPYLDCDKNCPLYECCNDQPTDNIEGWLKSAAGEVSE